MDKISKEKRGEVMRAIRGKDTKIEIAFRTALWKLGTRYRKNSGKFYGRPDIVNEKRRVVVFLDSCFWHGCSLHCRMPKSHLDFWRGKIKRNKKRDALVNKFYKERDWTCVRIWEHDIINKNDFKKTIKKVSGLFSKGQLTSNATLGIDPNLA